MSLDDDIILESVLEDNQKVLALAQKHGQNYVLIDDEYGFDVDIL